jgi:acetylglutamate kinase
MNIDELLASNAQFCIVGAETKANRRTVKKVLKLLGLPVIRGVGVYKGEREACYLVENDTLARMLGTATMQECILNVVEGQAWFDSDKDAKYVGKWQQVEEAEAMQHDGYTYINMQYYVCK